MVDVLLPTFLLAGALFATNTMLRRHGDKRLYKRTIQILGALTVAAVFSIIAAIYLGIITDHYP